MAYEFKLPDIGEGVVEGEIVKWLVKEGDVVAEDQPLVEVMTDKATVTIPSPKRGKVLKRFGAEGSIAKVHEPLVSLELEGGEAAKPAPAVQQQKPPAAAAPRAAAPAAAAPAPMPSASGTYEFKLPDIGEGVVEGEIVKWLVKDGDVVAEDQPLVEVMTDKATVTIPSPKRGKVLTRHGAEGAIAKVHAPLVTLQLEGAPAVSAGHAAPTPKAPAAAPVQTGAGHAPAAAPMAARPANGELKNGKILATPVTRRIAREAGMDLHTIAGSGPQGRILKRDVLAIIEGQKVQAPAPTLARAPFVAPAPAPVAPPPVVSGAEEERMPIRGLRRAIFKKMVQSEQFAVPFTYVDEIDMTELVAFRERINKRLEKEGLKLTFLPFITKALIAALRKFPHMNAIMDEEKQELVVKRSYNMGIGVATEGGLTVAVIHDADKRSLRGLGQELERLSKAARENKLTMHELSGSTFTITSLGKDGGMFATPVINHPEVGILGIHRIEPRPVVVNREIVIRDRMYMSCTFDHRIIDGHVGAAFVAEVKKYLEDPELLMLELS